MSNSPREYDREYATPVTRRSRKRLRYDRQADTITRFVVQLEYEIDESWNTVVRYDHNGTGEFGHDVSEEGIHIDIYRNGTKYRREYVAHPMPAKRALDRAEDHLANTL